MFIYSYIIIHCAHIPAVRFSETEWTRRRPWPTLPWKIMTVQNPQKPICQYRKNVKKAVLHWAMRRCYQNHFWPTIKPFISSSHDANIDILLCENDSIISESETVAKIFNKYLMKLQRARALDSTTESRKTLIRIIYYYLWLRDMMTTPASSWQLKRNSVLEDRHSILFI